MQRLFAVADPPAEETNEAARFQALGIASEHLAIGRLLDLGHKVAVPVTDDDGVDLIIDYRHTAQVKSGASRRDDGVLVINLHSMRSAERSRKHSVREHIDFFLVRARDTNEWWVIPREAMPKSASLSLGRRYDQWRDAWSVLR